MFPAIGEFFEEDDNTQIGEGQLSSAAGKKLYMHSRIMMNNILSGL
jgi:hypothetical protein